MAEITAALVKELRERTGEGMMDCKKALTKAGGDIEKAIDDMRASGAIKAAKKAGNVAAEGAIAIKDDGKAAVLLEVNSQTDFLALQDDFKAFVAASVDKAFADKLTDAAPLIEAQEEARLVLVGKTGENVNIRRLVRVEGDVVGTYLHGNKIGVAVVLKGGDTDLAKDIAMHVAATNPEFLLPSDVSAEAIEREKGVFLQLNEEKLKGKPAEIAEKWSAAVSPSSWPKPAWLSRLSSRTRKSKLATWRRKPVLKSFLSPTSKWAKVSRSRSTTSLKKLLPR